MELRLRVRRWRRFARGIKKVDEARGPHFISSWRSTQQAPPASGLVPTAPARIYLLEMDPGISAIRCELECCTLHAKRRDRRIPLQRGFADVTRGPLQGPVEYLPSQRLRTRSPLAREVERSLVSNWRPPSLSSAQSTSRPRHTPYRRLSGNKNAPNLLGSQLFRWRLLGAFGGILEQLRTPPIPCED
jgi:hypothetical protein